MSRQSARSFKSQPWQSKWFMTRHFIELSDSLAIPFGECYESHTDELLFEYMVLLIDIGLFKTRPTYRT